MTLPDFRKFKPTSPRTTAAGVLLVVITICIQVFAALDEDPATTIDFDEIVLAAVAGYGFLNGRDNNVTSEEAGAPGASSNG